MSRSSRQEQSAFSLFPFLAVLLCTMGAMVVLLVAMAHVSRQKAAQEAALAAQSAPPKEAIADDPQKEALKQKIQESAEALSKIEAAAEQVTERLANEQQRLSDIEGHIDRLTSEAEELKTEAAELFAVEQEHDDDTQQAQEELERLNELIGQMQDDLEAMKYAAAGRERKYAVVPLRDARTGTVRPARYFECDEQGITVQPESIRLKWEDLVAPEFSSPLAAVTRVIRRYYEEHPETRAANEVGKPYSLLIVRPEGVTPYYLARNSFESVGADYGYQPVADDWPLEYGESNPVLASRIEEALTVARAEREGLARVVPKLAASMAAAQQGPALKGRTTVVAASQSAGTEAGIRVRRAKRNSNNPFAGLRIEGTLPGEQSGSGANSKNAAATLSGPLAQPGSGKGLAMLGEKPIAGALDAAGGQEIGGTGSPPARSQANAPEGSGQRMAGAATASPSARRPPSGGAAAPSSAGTTASSNAEPPMDPPPPGKRPNRRKPGRQRSGMPIVRPIRLYVTPEQVALVPDRGLRPDEAAALGSTQTVNFAGRTTDQINELIGVLKTHADSWGIAGDGMYWDPRMTLSVTPAGTQRADEVRQLLEAAGFQVKIVPTATAVYPTTEGGTGATRR